MVENERILAEWFRRRQEQEPGQLYRILRITTGVMYNRVEVEMAPVSALTAREIIRAGAPFWLFGEPKEQA